MQEKNKTVWEASLKVANTTDGEKVLYAVTGVKKVEGPGTSGTTTTEVNVPQSNESVKHSFRGENAADHDQTALDAAQMQDAFDQLQELWTEGVADAAGNFEKADIQESYNTEQKFMSRDIRQVTEETVRKDLQSVFDGINVASNSYIPLSKTTPFAVRYITGYKKDLPIIVDKKKAWVATLKVANTTNGEKILYAISNIKKVEGPGTSGTTATNNNVPQANESVKHSFRGENAADHDQTALDAAKQMRSDGADSETIRKETGWFVGADRKWRFEISDRDMQLKTVHPRTYTTLGELVYHRKLFQSYPNMRDLAVWFEDLNDATGKYDRSIDTISLDKSLRDNPEKLLDTLTHEIQHAIQYREGFTKGASPEY